MPELDPYGGAHHLGVPRVDGARQHTGRIRAEGGRGAEQGAKVPRVLDPIKHQEARRRAEGERVEGPGGLFGDDEDPLRLLGITGGEELPFTHPQDVDVACMQLRGERGPARGAIEEVTGQGPDHPDRRGEQCLDGAHPLGDEASAPLARLAACQVPCYGQ